MSSFTPIEIIKLGNPRLRKASAPIQFPLTGNHWLLLGQMMDAMRNAEGVGIAAPQLGHLVQLIIVSSRPTPRYPNAPSMDPLVMINPQILAYSEILEDGWEGCLSVPDTRGLVPRAKDVTVSYFDTLGSQTIKTFSDFVARIIQHEWDHLTGTLFIDRVSSSEQVLNEDQYQQALINF